MDKEFYLGDGCYVSFDGTAFWLRAPRENGDHLVALEPSALALLNEFAASLKRPTTTPKD